MVNPRKKKLKSGRRYGKVAEILGSEEYEAVMLEVSKMALLFGTVHVSWVKTKELPLWSIKLKSVEIETQTIEIWMGDGE